MAELSFDITGNNSNALRAFEETSRGAKQMMDAVEQSGSSIEGVFTKIASLAGVGFSVSQVQGFIDKLISVRGYFQDVQSSMEVFLGSEQKAAQFTDKLKDYAYYNMFEFKDLAAASKQMIAYHTEVEDVIPVLDKLSNIATGTNADLMDLVAMYNRAKSIGTIHEQQLQQWATRGVLVKETLKEMGETVNKTGVTFEQLTKVIDKVTGEGGMFHDLMLNQMENLSAEEGQLQDELDGMFNEIGEKYQDFLKGTIDARIWLVENYEQIGKTILWLVGTYGAWKAALVATNAVNKSVKKMNATKELEELQKEIDATKALLPAKEAAKNADLKEMVAKGQLTQAQSDLIAKKREELVLLEMERKARVDQLNGQLSQVTKEVDAANAVVEAKKEDVEVSEQLLAKAQERQAAADALVEKTKAVLEAEEEAMEGGYGGENYSNAKDEYDAAIAEQAAAANEVKAMSELKDAEATELSEAADVAKAAASKQETIQNELSTLSNNAESASEAKNTVAKNVNTTATKGNTIATKLNAIQDKAAAATKAILTAAINGVKNAFNAMKTAMATNPFGVVLVGISMLLPLLEAFSDEEDEVTTRSNKFGKAMDVAIREVNTLFGVLDAAARGGSTKTIEKAMEDLTSIYKDYGIIADDEKATLDVLIAKRDELTAAIKREAAAREEANQLSDIASVYEKNIEGIWERVAKKLGDEEGGYLAQVIKAALGDEESIKQFADVYEKYMASVDKMVKRGKDALTEEDLRNEQEYLQLQSKLIKSLEAYGKTTQEAFNIVQKFAQNKFASELRDEKLNADAATEATKKAAQATKTWSAGQELAAFKNALNKESVKDVKEEVDALALAVSANKEMSIYIKAHYDDSELPAQFKNLTGKQLAYLGKSIQETLERHKGDKFVFGKEHEEYGFSGTYTRAELAKIGAQATVLGQQAINAEYEKTKITPTAPTTPKKSGKQWDAAKAAAEVQDIKDTFVKGVKDATKDMNKEIANLETGMMVGAQRTFMELVNNAKNELDDLDAEYDKMIENMEKRDLEIWKKSGPNNNEGNYKKKTREEYETELKTEGTELNAWYKAWLEKSNKVVDNQRKSITDATNELLSSYDEYSTQRMTKAEKLEADIKQMQDLYAESKDEAERKRILAAIDFAKEQYNNLDRDLLEKYGDFVTRKKLLEEDGEKEIAKLRAAYDAAQSPEEKERIQQAIKNAQKANSEALSSFGFEELQKGIQWDKVFGDLDKMSTLSLQSMITMLEKYIATNKDLSPEIIERISKAIKDMKETVATRNPFDNLAGSVTSLITASRRYKSTQKELDKLNKTSFNSTQSLGDAYLQASASGDVATKEQIENTKVTIKAHDAEGNLVDMTLTYKEALEKLNGELEDNADEQDKSNKKLSAAADWIGQNVVGVAQKTMGLADALGIELPEGVSQAVEGLGDLQQGLTAFAQGDFIGGAIQMVTGVVNMIKGLGNTIASIFGGGPDNKSYNEALKRFEALRDVWQDIIDKKKEYLGMSWGVEAERAADEAIDVQKKYNKAQRELGKEWLNSGSGWFSHSQGVEQRKNMSDEAWSQLRGISGALGSAYGNIVNGRMTGLFDLTLEQLNTLKEQAPLFWGELQDETKEYLQGILDGEEALKDIQDQLKGRLTGTTFESFRDSFFDTLSDMDKGWRELTDDFSSQLQASILKSLLANKYSARIEALYEQWATAFDDGVSAEESERLREEAKLLAQEMASERDELAKVFDWGKTFSQEGSSKGFGAMSQDTAEELNGRFTALQVAGEDIRNQMITAVECIKGLSVAMINKNGVLDEMRNLLFSSNGYLEDIARYAKMSSSFGEKLDLIVEHTKRL